MEDYSSGQEQYHGYWHLLVKYDRLRPYTGKIRSFTTIYGPYTNSVFLRISPYTATEIYDRNTGPCNTEKYGRIRSVYGMYTVVYDIVYGRKRSYTEAVTADLGTNRAGFLKFHND